MAQPEPDFILQTYQLACKHSKNMLDFARHERWDDLIEEEKKREEIIGRLLVVELTDTVVVDIIELINQMLACDAETQSLARLWKNELDSLLHSVDSSKKLQQAYRVD